MQLVILYIFKYIYTSINLYYIGSNSNYWACSPIIKNVNHLEAMTTQRKGRQLSFSMTWPETSTLLKLQEKY